MSETAQPTPTAPTDTPPQPVGADSPDQSGPASARDARTGQFRAGNSGRPRGIRDRRSQAKEKHLDFIENGDESLGLAPRRTRIIALLTCDDPNIRMAAEKFWWEQDFGKAKETKEITHHGSIVDEAIDHMRGRIWQSSEVAPPAPEHAN